MPSRSMSPFFQSPFSTSRFFAWKSAIAFIALGTLLHFDTTLATDSKPGIVVNNHKAGSEVRYPVILLRGQLDNTEIEDANTLKIANAQSPEHAQPVTVITRGSQFKALVHLSEGKNSITLEHPSATTRQLEITYTPQTNPHYVRLIWMTDDSGQTEFATPNDSVTQDYEARLRTAALLMQTFTAERMRDLGYGQRTFRLETDADGQIIVHTWKGDRPKEDYYAQADNQTWWPNIRRWIGETHPDPMAKNVVLAAYTRKDPRTGKMLGHTALGGANLGLFGSASVFSWPRDIQTAMKVFQDDSPIDATRVHDDSAFRSRVWALASTTIGATLHETGHAMGLPHCTDPMGIMTRGFDHFHRVFTFQDPPSNQNKNVRPFSNQQEAYFAPVSASFLRWSPWFALDAPDSTGGRPKVDVDEAEGIVSIQSASGIAWIGFHSRDTIETFREYGSHGTPADDHPEKVELTFEEIRQIKPNKDIRRIVVLTPEGVSRNVRLPETKTQASGS
ncbi:metallopeptidase [Rhodopirellula sp. JC740]|uniref:Metallopeptidase n=1 Tax=Rhodopirellula halodulae TaxID=2894198 RepID=A0ABS8NM54_9BACT|nr:metallopeptidase [Rhodopirellula sp. JC740]MCC9644630.1 metallopeptidase [Rhodopirellula sp. JC740]